MDTKKLGEFIQLAAKMKDFKEETEQIVDPILENFGPIIKKIFSSVATGYADITIEQIRKFKEAGFTKQEAMFLAVTTKHNLQETISMFLNNKQKDSSKGNNEKNGYREQAQHNG